MIGHRHEHVGWDCCRNGADSKGWFDLGNENGQTTLICACCERLSNLLSVRREDGKADNRALGRGRLVAKKRRDIAAASCAPAGIDVSESAVARNRDTWPAIGLLSAIAVEKCLGMGRL